MAIAESDKRPAQKPIFQNARTAPCPRHFGPILSPGRLGPHFVPFKDWLFWPEVNAYFPADTDELCFHVQGIIKDVKRLKLLFELFTETLDQLCRIGSAYEEAPKVKL